MIKNYIQSAVINEAIKIAKLPKNVSFFIGVVTNIDKISVVQWILGQMGAYKYLAWGVWFLVFA
jgi:hypothetical protein